MRHILVVEDSPTQAEQLRLILEEFGFHVTVASDAEKALDAFVGSAFDLVITDVVMPGLSGYDLCRRLKAHPVKGRTPVVVLTRLADPLDILRGLDCGADSYLTKPFAPEALLDRLQYLFANQARRVGDQAAAGVEVYVRGKTFTVTSEKGQILDLLIAVCEDVVAVNGDLRARQAELAERRAEIERRNAQLLQARDELEGRVADRTAERRRAADLLRAVADETPDALFVKDREGRYLLFNRAAARFVGRPAEEVLGKDDTALFEPEDARLLMERDRQVMESGRAETEEERLTAAGVTRTYLATKAPYRDERGYVVGVIGISRDITDRKRAESEHDALLARLQLHIQRMPLAYVLKDADFRIIEWNPMAERIFGYSREEMLGTGPPHERYVPPLFWKKSADLLRRIRAGDMEAHSVNDNLTKDGRTITCQWFNTPIMGDDGQFVGLLCMATDVTAQKILESQLRQAQKMEAVGQLAGGVAHDFNNLLQVIMGYGELILATLQPDDPSRELIGEMTRAGERAAGLTRQLLAFSRQSVLAPRVLVLNSVVIDLEKMLRRVIGEDIDLKTNLRPDMGRIKADPGQIEQVILNLAVNSRDAMPQGGKLTIETADAELDEQYARLHAGVQPGPYVLLAVSDTGHGMTPEVRAHIFEPFFTTKEQGKGTGLGLATVFGIVQQAGGHVAVHSEPGVGTSFKVYLPRVEEAPAAAERKSNRTPELKGTETILLVEDEDAVRSLTRTVLRGAGYRVLEASDGGEAVKVAAQHTGKIHLLLSDVVMPVLGGRELAERLVALHPEMKVLFQSGYTDDAVVRHGVLQEKVHFLQKPYTPTALAQKVREVLDSAE